MLKLEELQSFPCFMKLNDKLCYDWNLYMENIDVCRFSNTHMYKTYIYIYYFWMFQKA